jgi:CheY-like chemotaxis protein
MSKHTILVAEDSDDDVFFLKRAITRAGLNVQWQVVANGEQAMAYLKGDLQYGNRELFPFPTLALLDIKMPRKNGLEVLKEIRCDPRLTRLLVVFLTSSDDPEDINLAYELHANSYLVKTNNAQDLELLIQKLEEYWLSLNACPDCPDCPQV